MPALDTHPGNSIMYNWQGILAGGGNNPHRADIRADPAAVAEVVVNKYRCHSLTGIVRTLFIFSA